MTRRTRHLKHKPIFAGLVGVATGAILMLVIFLLYSGIFSQPSGVKVDTPANISDRECWPIARIGCGPKLYAGLSSNPCDHNYYFSASALQKYQGKVITPQNFTLLGPYVDLGNPPGTCVRPVCFEHKLPPPFWNITLAVIAVSGIAAAFVSFHLRNHNSIARGHTQ